jgi:membrane-bound ClpP family serine protease
MSKKNKPEEKKVEFALGKENYKLLAIGFGIIILGFILMIGGKAESPEVFNEEIFSFRRITLAPIIVLAGFIFEIYAIMKKPKESDSPEK